MGIEATILGDFWRDQIESNHQEAIFLVLVIVNVVMFAIGALGAPVFTRVLRIPEPILIGLILIISTVGAYGVNGNLFDVWIAFGAGAAGAILRYFSYPVAPIVIGMVLGPTIEMSLRQGLILTRGDALAFFQRPIALMLFIITAAILLWPLVRRLRARERT